MLVFRGVLYFSKTSPIITMCYVVVVWKNFAIFLRQLLGKWSLSFLTPAIWFEWVETVYQFGSPNRNRREISLASGNRSPIATSWFTQSHGWLSKVPLWLWNLKTRRHCGGLRWGPRATRSYERGDDSTIVWSLFGILTQMLHIGIIYLQRWTMATLNKGKWLGKYSLHRASGLYNISPRDMKQLDCVVVSIVTICHYCLQISKPSPKDSGT